MKVGDFLGKGNYWMLDESHPIIKKTERRQIDESEEAIHFGAFSCVSVIRYQVPSTDSSPEILR